MRIFVSAQERGHGLKNVSAQHFARVGAVAAIIGSSYLRFFIH